MIRRYCLYTPVVPCGLYPLYGTTLVPEDLGHPHLGPSTWKEVVLSFLFLREYHLVQE